MLLRLVKNTISALARGHYILEICWLNKKISKTDQSHFYIGSQDDMYFHYYIILHMSYLNIKDNKTNRFSLVNFVDIYNHYHIFMLYKL